MRYGLLLFAMACAAGCDEVEPVRAESDTFIAFQRDFADFRTWRRFEITSQAIPIGHPEGPSFIYARELPPAGEARFPVGTILIKTIETGAPREWAIHAMVKRGGDFGLENGTVGWEFFELRFDEDEVPVIAWRGPGPPSGLGYRSALFDGGTAELVCSDCHAAAWQNDSVLNPHTRLTYWDRVVKGQERAVRPRPAAAR